MRQLPARGVAVAQLDRQGIVASRLTVVRHLDLVRESGLTVDRAGTLEATTGRRAALLVHADACGLDVHPARAIDVVEVHPRRVSVGLEPCVEAEGGSPPRGGE